jgi:hypothetical protein
MRPLPLGELFVAAGKGENGLYFALMPIGLFPCGGARPFPTPLEKARLAVRLGRSVCRRLAGAHP